MDITALRLEKKEAHQSVRLSLYLFKQGLYSASRRLYKIDTISTSVKAASVIEPKCQCKVETAQYLAIDQIDEKNICLYSVHSIHYARVHVGLCFYTVVKKVSQTVNADAYCSRMLVVSVMKYQDINTWLNFTA